MSNANQVIQAYLWNGHNVRTLKVGGYTWDDYEDQYMVDTRYDEAIYRYGIYPSVPPLKCDVRMVRVTDWQHVPFKDFPAEFRAHLLLLGVT